MKMVCFRLKRVVGFDLVNKEMRVITHLTVLSLVVKAIIAKGGC